MHSILSGTQTHTHTHTHTPTKKVEHARVVFYVPHQIDGAEGPYSVQVCVCVFVRVRFRVLDSARVCLLVFVRVRVHRTQTHIPYTYPLHAGLSDHRPGGVTV